MNDPRTTLQKYYDEHLRGVVDQKNESVRAQAEAAIKDAPADARNVDAWFGKHFHKAPISHDTTLYNVLHAAKADIRRLFTPAAAPARTPAAGV